MQKAWDVRLKKLRGFRALRGSKKAVTNNMAKKNKKKAKKKAKRKPAKRQPALTVTMVKAWGFECDNMTTAALKYKGNLVGRLKRSKPLTAAWQRGRFLRNIAGFAGAGATKAEVAIQLGHDLTAFEELLAEPEAADVWVTAQNNAMLAIKMGIKDQAIEGKPAAIKSMTRIFENERPAGTVLDVYKVTMKQLASIAQVTRETVHQWISNKGLTRAGDNTVDMRQAWQWWEIYSQRKVNVTPQANAPDDHRDVKTARLKLLYDEERGKLLPRDAVIAGLVARSQKLITIFDRRKNEIAGLCVNQPAVSIAKVLEKFFEETRRDMCQIDIELKFNPPELMEEFKSFLEKLE